jgi:hypothetical protein
MTEHLDHIGAGLFAIAITAAIALATWPDPPPCEIGPPLPVSVGHTASADGELRKGGWRLQCNERVFFAVGGVKANHNSMLIPAQSPADLSFTETRKVSLWTDNPDGAKCEFRTIRCP